MAGTNVAILGNVLPTRPHGFKPFAAAVTAKGVKRPSGSFAHDQPTSGHGTAGLTERGTDPYRGAGPVSVTALDAEFPVGTAGDRLGHPRSVSPGTVSIRGAA